MSKESEVLMMFRSLDLDNKGYLTLEDIKDRPDLMPTDIFYLLNVNKDGKLTFAEFEQGFMNSSSLEEYDKITRDIKLTSSIVDRTLKKKAIDLFRLYDVENKGFITKKDLAKFKGPMHISDELFNSLDDNDDGLIRFEEFEAGLLGNSNSPEYGSSSYLNTNFTLINSNSDSDYENSEDADEEFEQMIQTVDAKDLVKNAPNLQLLWNHLRKKPEDFEKLKDFEDFISKLALELRNSQDERSALKNTLTKEKNYYENLIKQLTEETEGQIELVKSRLILQENSRVKQLQDELNEKNRELNDSIDRQHELERKLNELARLKKKQDEERELVRKISRENSRRRHSSISSDESIRVSVTSPNGFEKKISFSEENNKINNNELENDLKNEVDFIFEREKLIKELNELKELNRKLQDERDELNYQTNNNGSRSVSPKNVERRLKPADRHGTLYKYLRKSDISIDEELYNPDPDFNKLKEIEEAEKNIKEMELQQKLEEATRKQAELEENLKNLKLLKRQKDEENSNLQLQLQQVIAKKEEEEKRKAEEERRRVEQEAETKRKEDSEIRFLKEKIKRLEKERICELKSSFFLKIYLKQKNNQIEELLSRQVKLEEELKTLKYFKELYKQENLNLLKEKNMLESMLQNETHHNSHVTYSQITKVENPFFDLDSSTSTNTDKFEKQILIENGYELAPLPESYKSKRQFKLVLLGDTSVGKTSYMRRVTLNKFDEKIGSTIGVDYSNKYLYVNQQVVNLMLWDTAGQERYRSIVKSYYRDADCFICMYDVTNEKSFLDIRDWLTSISENTQKVYLPVIIGNKIDLLNENERAILFEDGEALAKENEALFFEISSKTCKNVFQSIEQIARSLLDNIKCEPAKTPEETIVPTSEEKEKKKCC